MTTPGRTHISWQTQTGQVHELISYIGFLEAKIQYLQQHHEHCDMFMGGMPGHEINPPYLPPDIIAAAEPQNPAFSPILPPSMELSLQQPSKPPESNPRWKRIVDQMTKGWDRQRSWQDKREAVGLDSVAKNKYALVMILGMKDDFLQSLQSYNILKTGQSQTNPAEALISSARKYAIDTKASSTNAGLIVQVHLFRELVFASLCVVMEQQGLPIDTINDLMRICMSSSGPANLYRLRRGALWVNRVIGGMMKKGWGHGATEFFLLCKRILRKLSRRADWTQLAVRSPNTDCCGRLACTRFRI
jgi:hypothetical protein